MKHHILKTALLLFLALPLLSCQDSLPKSEALTNLSSTSTSQPTTQTVISSTGSQSVSQPSSGTTTPTSSTVVYPSLPTSDSVAGSRTDSAKAFHLAYNGDYPIDLTGKPLPTYSVQTSWPDTIYFNQHLWNHWPRVNGSFNVTEDRKSMGCTFWAGDGLGREVFGFRIPAKIGLFRKEMLQYQIGTYYYPFFTTTDDDVTINHYRLAEEADNWVVVTRYDSLNRRVAGRFSLFFKPIETKRSGRDVVYPTVINMHGSFNTFP